MPGRIECEARLAGAFSVSSTGAMLAAEPGKAWCPDPPTMIS